MLELVTATMSQETPEKVLISCISAVALPGPPAEIDTPYPSFMAVTRTAP
jgi:hypothetical protein